MPGIFAEVTLSWKGREHVIPPDRMMGAIAVVEEGITLIELHMAQMTGRIPLAKVSMAYARVLRYAGAVARDDEVYNALFSKADNPDKVNSLRAMETLLLLMVPPDTYKNAEVTPKGKVAPGAAKSSKKPTR